MSGLRQGFGCDVVVYVSGHGYGHSVRTAVVLRALLGLRPETRAQVVTDAPEWLFPSAVARHTLRTDVGLVQRDGLEHDEEATLLEAGAYLEALDATADAESARLRDLGVRMVLGDIPPLAFEVAARLDVPGVGLGNFTWDDIYAPFVRDRPGFRPLVERLRASYSRASLLLRLPFHLEMSAFPQREDIPLVARQPRGARLESRHVLGIPSGATAVLLAFGGFDLPDLDVDALAGLRSYVFVRPVPNPRGWVLPNLLEVAGPGLLSFPDMLAASDAVVTKPGYGMVADVLACRVPALYAPRPRFAEYPVLAEALQRNARALEVPRSDLVAGRLGPYLEQLLRLERPWKALPMNGGEVAATRLAGMLG